MTKISSSIFLSFIYGFVAWNISLGDSIAAQDDYFDEKDRTFWVLKNKTAFKEAPETLIDDEGNWKGQPPAPQYIKFVQELTEDDIPTLVRWLSLKDLTCFSIAGQYEQPNLQLILTWFSALSEDQENLQKVHFDKLAWLNFKTMSNQRGRGEASILSPDSLETHRAFQMADSHYFQIGIH
jgi:hypothetical protein